MDKLKHVEFDSGIRREFYTSHTEDKLLVKSSQDDSEILQINRENQKWNDKRVGSGFKHVAFIPNVIIEELIRKGIWQDTKALKKWLNNSSHAAFRTDRPFGKSSPGVL